MNKWYLKMYLKSGKVIRGTIESPLTTSDDVSKELFQIAETAVIGIRSNTGGNLFFRLASVDAYEISVKYV